MLLRETFEPDLFTQSTQLSTDAAVAAGPRLAFQSAWSTNAVSICGNCGRQGDSPRTGAVDFNSTRRPDLLSVGGGQTAFASLVHDRMTGAHHCPPPLSSPTPPECTRYRVAEGRGVER